jgi:hypothetical protein
VFDDFIKWHSKAVATKVNFNSGPKPTREKVLQNIDKHFDMSALTPKKQQYKLLSNNEEVPVVYFDFLESLKTLLNDPDLMRPENLIDYDPTIDLEDPTSVLDDINTGTVWEKAHNFYVSDPETQKLIPIIFFMDKTHTDINGRLKLEPVSFTLGIFNRKCRSNPLFWRTLGFVTDIDVNVGNASVSELKQQDYHNMLKIVLASFEKAQQRPVAWKFTNESGTNIKNCIFPVLFIIGDTDGHDKLCGRYLSRTNIQRLCRYCNISFLHTDDPFIDYQFT